VHSIKSTYTFRAWEGGSTLTQGVRAIVVNPVHRSTFSPPPPRSLSKRKQEFQFHLKPRTLRGASLTEAYGARRTGNIWRNHAPTSPPDNRQTHPLRISGLLICAEVWSAVPTCAGGAVGGVPVLRHEIGPERGQGVGARLRGAPGARSTQCSCCPARRRSCGRASAAPAGPSADPPADPQPQPTTSPTTPQPAPHRQPSRRRWARAGEERGTARALGSKNLLPVHQQTHLRNTATRATTAHTTQGPSRSRGFVQLGRRVTARASQQEPQQALVMKCRMRWDLKCSPRRTAGWRRAGKERASSRGPSKIIVAGTWDLQIGIWCGV